LPEKRKSAAFDESKLTKGQVRKLNALRKSVGVEIGNKAFADWLVSRPNASGPEVDRDAEAIAEILWPKVEKKAIRIPRGGYILRRGRGRIIVEPTQES